MKKLFSVKTALALALTMCIATTAVSAAPWSFGVMSDTQWTAPTTGVTPIFKFVKQETWGYSLDGK